MRAQTQILEQDSSALAHDEAWDEVAGPILIYERMDKGEAKRVERDLEEGAFRALLADDQSSSRPGGPIGKHRSLVEAKPQMYRAACDSTHRDIWKGAMRQEFQGLVKNKTFELAELPAGRTPITAKWVFSWKTDQAGEISRERRAW